MPDFQTIIEECIEASNIASEHDVELLTMWEIDFLESIQKRHSLTGKQQGVLDRIYKKVCDSPY